MCSLEQRGRVFVLTLTGRGQHLLNPDLISAVRAALSAVRAHPAPSALVTTAEGNFFSNGFDLAWAGSDISRLAHMVDLLCPLVADLLSLPMPTVAAVTGHAAAAGLVLTLAHDDVLMRCDRGVFYLKELDIGLPLPPYFAALLRAKIADPRALRDVALRAAKLRGEEAEARGIVDRVVGTAPETLEAAMCLAGELIGRGWKGDVYASIRMNAFPDACRSVGLTVGEEEGGFKQKVAGASKL